MISIQHLLPPVLTTVMIVLLTSCSSNVPIDESSETPINQPDPQTSGETTISKPETSPVPPPLKEPTAPPANTIPVTLYQADSACQNLVPRRTTLPAEQSLELAVRQVLDNYESADFSLGYRIIRHQHTITIDFRVPSNSPRVFTSLSSCEQLALFGSLRQTLTSNPVWQIQQVHFTNRGQEIVL
ncbi:hypothetical protein ACOKW7_26990 [Limnospira platensis CENA597]|uniref:hypothetical protein n=1 Tax=Limnospira platensis TaxID=118562 RepID=UPI003D6E8DF4